MHIKIINKIIDISDRIILYGHKEILQKSGYQQFFLRLLKVNCLVFFIEVCNIFMTNGIYEYAVVVSVSKCTCEKSRFSAELYDYPFDYEDD